MDTSKFNGIGRGRGRRLNNANNTPNSNNNINSHELEDEDLSINKLSINENKENCSSSVRDFTSTNQNHVKLIEDGDNTLMAIPRVSYIPDDNAEEYQLHVNSGINFDNYDSIQVHVTGRNIPESISALNELQLPEFLTENIRKSEYHKLTPVQKYTIPMIMNKRDVMACAQTGSGKTVAFLVPIIKDISENISKTSGSNANTNTNSPQCVIVVPTRELCRQIFTVANRLCRDSKIKCSYSYGGVEMRTSMQKLYRCDILVSTPGRLVANIESGAIVLDRICYLVLDEADRLLQNEMFLDAIRLIYDKSKSISKSELEISFHVSMFSATFPAEIQQLGESLMRDYLFVAVGPVGCANGDIKQLIIRASNSSSSAGGGGNKLNAALDYIMGNQTGKTLVFVQAKRFADFLGIRLIDLGLSATTIHGDRDQAAREMALNDFKSGRVAYLVATDVASRGLDIPLVDTVINIDMPEDLDVYIHRIGRTGRCGNVGLSVSFFDEDKDIGLAPRLVKVLKESGQECPDWLESLCGGYGGRNGSSGASRDRKDYRRNVESSTFVEKKFMNANDEQDDFFN